MTKTFKKARIRPVSGFGIGGYQVEFSVLDLCRLREMALQARSCKPNQVDALCDVIDQLVMSTVGNAQEQFDFLEETEVLPQEQ